MYFETPAQIDPHLPELPLSPPPLITYLRKWSSQRDVVFVLVYEFAKEAVGTGKLGAEL